MTKIDAGAFLRQSKIFINLGYVRIITFALHNSQCGHLLYVYQKIYVLLERG